MYDISELDVDRFHKLLRDSKNLEHWDDYFENLHEQMSISEYKIQKWWASKIDLIGKKVNILNSGVGFYSVPFCFEKGAVLVKTYDMCPITRSLAWRINQSYHTEWDENKQDQINYYHRQLDIVFDKIKHFDDNKAPDEDYADVYINTSCEHSYYMRDIIPDGTIAVLSGNNLTKRGHINRIQSVKQLIDQGGITKVMFRGEILLDHTDELGYRNYSQFFVIGKKG